MPSFVEASSRPEPKTPWNFRGQPSSKIFQYDFFAFSILNIKMIINNINNATIVRM
jgi:hypothetical protein